MDMVVCGVITAGLAQKDRIGTCVQFRIIS
jgi:hypothetical protein